MLNRTILRNPYTKDPEERRQRLGKQIQNRRKELRMTQPELAEKCGFHSVSVIHRIEQGRNNNVTIDQLFVLAKSLDVNISYLLELWEVPCAGDEIVLNYDNSYASEMRELSVILTRTDELLDTDLKERLDFLSDQSFHELTEADQEQEEEETFEKEEGYMRFIKCEKGSIININMIREIHIVKEKNDKCKILAQIGASERVLESGLTREEAETKLTLILKRINGSASL